MLQSTLTRDCHSSNCTNSINICSINIISAIYNVYVYYTYFDLYSCMVTLFCHILKLADIAYCVTKIFALYNLYYNIHIGPNTLHKYVALIIAHSTYGCFRLHAFFFYTNSVNIMVGVSMVACPH